MASNLESTLGSILSNAVQGPKEISQDFLSSLDEKRSVAATDLIDLFERNKDAFKSITNKEAETILVKGKAAKQKLQEHARVSGTDQVKWRGMIIRMSGQVQPEELTWARVSAIVAAWGFFGKLGSTPGYTGGGAMCKAMSDSKDERFDTFWKRLMCPGYHLIGSVILKQGNPFQHDKKTGDIGRFLAGALLQDYLTYLFQMRQNASFCATFSAWVQSLAGVPINSTLQKAIMTFPKEELTKAEGEAMKIITTAQITRETGTEGNKKAIEAFAVMAKEIFLQ